MPSEPEKKVFKALPYELDYMTDELRKRAKAELFEDEDTRVHSLNLLKNKLDEEKGLNWQDDDRLLLAFLRARKFDVKRASSVIKNFYNVMRKHSELYENFDFSKVKRTLEACQIGFLPYRDEEGCCVLVFSTRNWNPAEHSMGDYMRALTCGLLNAIRSPSTQVAGFKVIVDFSGFSFRQLPHISPTYLWLFAEALQNCFPGRFRAVHIVNETHLFTYVWAVLKQFLSAKLTDRFQFHGKNVKKLHKYFHPSILPAEYGGELPKFNNAEWSKHMESTADYLTTIFSYGYEKKNKSR